MPLPPSREAYDLIARYLGRWGTAALRLLPPELSHELGLWLLERGLLNHLPMPEVGDLLNGLAIEVPGLGPLSHPIGLAAGFDKHARCPRAWAQLGFAFMEIGTVTPRPQPGNAKPRIFRQSSQLGLVNRMGFPSDGMSRVAERLKALRWVHDKVPLGLNLGKNKETADQHAVLDFIAGIDTFSAMAKFFVINISSPNTPGLRGLANEEFLAQLQQRAPSSLSRMWIKLDPDMDKAKFQHIIGVIAKLGFAGVVLTNTHRVERPETGGQSGHLLGVMSATRLEWAYEVHRGSLAMIASGGILSGGDVFERLARGAQAVEIYTALVYRGPWAVIDLLEELREEMRLRGFGSVNEVVGSFYGA
jgi:dihydroorotate dehydrogenase